MRTLTEQTAVVRQLLQQELQAGHNHEVECLQSTLMVLTQQAVRPKPEQPTVCAASELPTSSSLYKQFEAAYHTFCQNETGTRGKMDGGQGKALNSIIEYLRENCNSKDDAGALASWKYLLSHWDKLSEFLKKQKTLTAINKYLMEIMETIRKATAKPTAEKKALLPHVERHRQKLLSELEDAENSLDFVKGSNPYPNQLEHQRQAEAKVSDLKNQLAAFA